MNKVVYLNQQDDPTSIGSLVVRQGICTKDEILRYLCEFDKLSEDHRFGQFLVSKDILSDEQLEMLLIKQDAERGGVQYHHIERAIEISAAVDRRISDDIDQFNGAAVLALTKVPSGTPR